MFQIEGMEAALVETAAQGGVSWRQLLANMVGQSPIARKGYLCCPRCGIEESFGNGTPTQFRRLQKSSEYANYLADIYVCRGCTHMFAPITEAQFNGPKNKAK